MIKVFVPDMFQKHCDSIFQASGCAHTANEILERIGKRVYGYPDDVPEGQTDTNWYHEKMGDETHSAILVGIHKIGDGHNG